MQLKLQLEGQVTELRNRVQELEKALTGTRQDYAELTEQYKVGRWNQGTKSELSEEDKGR